MSLFCPSFFCMCYDFDMCYVVYDDIWYSAEKVGMIKLFQNIKHNVTVVFYCLEPSMFSLSSLSPYLSVSPLDRPVLLTL